MNLAQKFSDLDNFDEDTITLSVSSLKQKLDTPDALANLINDRLIEGHGECLFELGSDNDGTPLNLSPEDFDNYSVTLSTVATKLKANCTLLHRKSTANIDSGYFLIRNLEGQPENILELRIAVVGNVDAGKSTLLGVLTKDLLDDGRGKARVNLFRHKHEIDSGRTSSVGLEIMGFTSTGKIVTPSFLGRQKLTWEDICMNSSKVLSFIDLAGHERYLKTTVFGMTGCAPDFVMLMVGANAGVIGMTKEHLGLAMALQVPVFIVVTKIDMCPANVLEATLKQLSKILKSNGCRKVPVFIKGVNDVLVTAGNFVSERICPIFQISNVTGEGLPLLKLFLNVIHANSGKYDTSQPVEYQITDTFSVPGVGTVVSGTITNGMVHVGDSLMLGPDATGQFIPTQIKSIQRKRVNVPVAAAGQSATFALKKVKRSYIRKGMVMVSKSLQPTATIEFEAEIVVLFHSTTLSKNYQTMVHCGVIRQPCKIVSMEKEIMRTGDRAKVHCRFLKRGEYLKVGEKILFREGRMKCVGKVVRCLKEGDKVEYDKRKADDKATEKIETKVADLKLDDKEELTSSGSVFVGDRRRKKK